jgi:hypothetical protein
VNSFVSMCEAIGSWHVSTLDTSFLSVVHSGQLDVCNLHFELDPVSLENIVLLQSPVYPLKFFDDFKLKTASKHPFLKQAIHLKFLNSYLESNHRIF